MKSIILMIGLLLAGVTQAATEALPFVQPPLTITQFHQSLSRCAATGFQGGTITGVCQYVYGTQSKYFDYPTALYYVSWSLDLSTSRVLSQCAATDPHHVYTGDGCKVNYNPTGTSVVIDGDSYYYVSSNGSGDELVSSIGQSFLVAN